VWNWASAITPGLDAQLMFQDVQDVIDLVYEDPVLLVLNKPSGLLSVPGRGEDKQDCLAARAQAIYPDALIVHRLDMDTSGLILMARGAEAQSTLSKAFAARQVHKRYQAVVEGDLRMPKKLVAGWAVIDLPLMLDWPNRPKHIVDQANGKPSRTHWRVLPKQEGDVWGVPATRLELEPYTGRSHQLRVHLQALGHPILGDSLYATPAGRAASDRLLLHACELSFAHPIHGDTLSFTSPAPF
jgi:tRNA pseudouridine32 synthase/23S rRNA pseudouridine746 synthase